MFSSRSEEIIGREAAICPDQGSDKHAPGRGDHMPEAQVLGVRFHSSILQFSGKQEAA
jgi:hypothetical protein